MRLLRRIFLTTLGTLAASSALYSGSGCGSGGCGTDLSDVVYEGEATDEGLLALLAEAPTDVPAHHAVFDTPLDGATLVSGAPITWHDPGAVASFAPRGGSRPEGDQRAPAGREPSWSREVFGPMRSALAHGAPMNGPAYLLELSSGGTCISRVFTTDTIHTPDATAFAKLAGKTVDLCLTGALFEENEVAVDGGPFVGSCITVDVP